MKGLSCTILFLISFLSYSQYDSLCIRFNKLPIDSNNEAKTKRIISYFEHKIINRYQLKSEKVDSFFTKLALICPEYLKYRQVQPLGKTNLKLWSEEEYHQYICKDSIQNVLTPWKEKKLKKQIEHCSSQIKDINKGKEICSCSINKLSHKMNYETFIELSEYQKGKVISTIFNKYCKVE